MPKCFLVLFVFLAFSACLPRQQAVSYVAPALVTEAVQKPVVVFRARFSTVEVERLNSDDYPESRFFTSFRGENGVFTQPCILTEAKNTITCPLPGIKVGSRIVLREPGGRGLCGVAWVEFAGQQPIKMESQPEDKYGCVFLLPTDAPP